MAIVIEEEKKGGIGILTVLTWLAILGAIGGAVYYIFFAQPQLVGKIIAPPGFEKTQEIIKINLNPKDVVDSLTKSYKQYISPLQPSTVGRPNPFMGS